MKERPKILRTRSKRCWGERHVKECRPGRPLCPTMRKAQGDKYAACFCPAVHFPHRRSYCVRGGAARYGFGYGPEQPPEAPTPELVEELAQAAFEDACAFFDELAAPVEIRRKAG